MWSYLTIGVAVAAFGIVGMIYKKRKNTNWGFLPFSSYFTFHARHEAVPENTNTNIDETRSESRLSGDSDFDDVQPEMEDSEEPSSLAPDDKVPTSKGCSDKEEEDPYPEDNQLRQRKVKEESADQPGSNPTSPMGPTWVVVDERVIVDCPSQTLGAN